MLVLGRKVSQKTVVTHKSGDVLEIIITRVEINRETGGFKINVGFHEPNGTRNFEIHRPERASGPQERDEWAKQKVESDARIAEARREEIADAYDRLQADARRAANEEVARLEQSINSRLAAVRRDAETDEVRLRSELDARRKARRDADFRAAVEKDMRST